MISRLRLGGAHAGRREARWRPVALVAGIVAITIALVVLGNALSERFASQLAAGLEARARHGARELAATSALGVELEDSGLFNTAVESYLVSSDIQAIAIEANGKILVSHGTIASVRSVFAAAPGALVRGPGYVASWAAGPRSNKIAVVMSTSALDDIAALQAEISYLILAIGAGAAVGCILVLRSRSRRTVGPGPSPAAATPLVTGGTSSASLHELAAVQQVMQQLLEHASQGFVVVELADQTVGDHSKIVERWFGVPTPETTLAGYLGARSVALATQLSIAASRLHDGSAPPPDALAQMPARMIVDDRTFDLRYAPILQGDKPTRLLIILNDITDQLARERAEREAREQRDVAMLAQLLTSNRSEFDEFFAEIARLIASLEAPSAADVELAAIRSLKDNCAYYGLESYVELCTSIEASLRETSAPMDDPQRLAVFDGWGRISSRLMRAGSAAQ